MDSVLNFLADYYLVFIGISVVLLFALIGFIVMSKKQPGDVAQMPSAEGETPSNTEDTSVIPQPESAQAPVEMQMQTETQAQPTVQQPISQTDQSMPSEPTLVIENPVPEQDMSMLPPEEPMPSNEPTLIINDPSATQTPDVNNQPATTPAQMDQNQAPVNGVNIQQ